ncbi:MAG: hypothetical protein PHE36_13605 [Novosphingobium sp.]|nr:hypothetical protein [Novosphingobium sp.]
MQQQGRILHRGRTEMRLMAMSYQDILKKQMDEKDAVTLSQKLTVLTQDLASFKNLSNDEAKQKIFSGLIGEAEPLRAVGVLLSDSAVKAKAAQMGLKKVGKEYSEGSKVQARAALIMEQLKDAQGDVVRTQDSAANKLKAANGAYTDMQEAIGGKLIPAMTPLIDKVIALLDWFNQLDPDTQGLIVKAIALSAALGPVMTVIGGLTSGIGVLLPVLRLMGPLFLTMGKAALRAGLMMLTNPLFLAVAIIATAGYLIWKHWDTIKAALGTAWEWLKAKFMQFPNMFGPLGIAVAFVIRNWDWIKATFWAGVEAIGNVWGALREKFNAAIDWFAGLGTRFYELGSNLIAGLAKGIMGKLSWLKDTVVGAAKNVADWFAKKLDINSPSRVFIGFGHNITEGLTQGIARGQGATFRQVNRLSVGLAARGEGLTFRPVRSLSAGMTGALAAGSMAMASLAGAAPGTAGALTIGKVEIHIHQQPGEDGRALARRVHDELTQLNSSGARSLYRDD